MAYYGLSEITGKTAVDAALTGDVPLRRPHPSVQNVGGLMVVHSVGIWTSGVVNLAINDVWEVAVLPAGCVLVDWLMLNDDFDSATTLQVRAGLMTGSVGDADRLLATVGAELLATGSTTLQAAAKTSGSVIAKVEAYRIAPSTSDRSIGIGIEAAPTNPATTRRLDFIMYYRAARGGV